MPDPMFSDTQNTSLIWKIITIVGSSLAAGVGILASIIWRKQDRAVENHESRISQLEAKALTREEFNGAQVANRNELKGEIKNVVDELRACSSGIHSSVDKLGERIENVLLTIIKNGN